MTTPNTNTPYAIISDAYFDAGKIRTGQVPSSEMFATGMRRLNDLINIEMVQGVKLWLAVDTAVPLTAGQAAYTFSSSGDVVMTRPLRVVEAYYLDADDNRRPLVQVAWTDWIKLPQPASTGTITQYFVEKLATQMRVTFWLTPDATEATGEVHLVLQTQATNPISLTETMAFPPEWRSYLRWGLADELATGQPQAIQQKCAQKAAETREILRNWDVEDAPTMFAPDPRGLTRSRFR